VGDGFLENYLPFLLHRSYQLLSETFHAGLADVGLDITECRIINSLADFGPLTLQRIQTLAYIVQPTASRACARLESRGLLTRRVGRGDKRQRIFELTEEGRAASRRLMEVSSVALDETLTRTSLDTRSLETLLKELIADLERSRPGNAVHPPAGAEQS
jgi:DNA-binding MarR family transcriptional regulator